MARLAAQTKMGHYPTPKESRYYIKNKLEIQSDNVILDPCCGDGEAVYDLTLDYDSKAYGVELDVNRASDATSILENVICGSIYEVIVRPIDSFSLLYLNPPYEWEDGERMEFRFLKQSHRWLKEKGVLLYIVPEHLITTSKIAKWIARRYETIHIYRLTRGDYPVFKQVVLFGIKREKEVEAGSFPSPPYPYIEDTDDDCVYPVPAGQIPDVFELQGIRPEDIETYQEVASKTIHAIINGVNGDKTRAISPLFPLRRGHLVSLLMSGVLNGRLHVSDRELVFKCFTERKQFVKTIRDDESAKEITTDTYMSGIRVIEQGKWYDVV